MNLDSQKNDCTDPVGLAAAEWVLRHDRGLTAAEQDGFSQWLAANPRHRAAWAEHRWGWDELDRLTGLQTSVHAVPDPDLLAPKNVRRFGFPLSPSLSLSVLAAAVIALGFVLWQRPLVAPKPGEGGWSQALAPVAPEAPRSLALIEQRELPDGSVVELNRGAVVTEQFTSVERRLRLERGEAHFKVAKDAQRPFVVEAAGVAVRAVGTAFNVRIDSAAVEVLVTEGKVSVALGVGPTLVAAPPPANLGMPPSDNLTLVATGERAIVSLAPAAPAPEVTSISPAEIEATLAWQPRLLDFTNETLAEIVAEFNRRNPVRVTLGDPALASLRLSATFRSDNVEGFVRLMVSDFGMRAEWRGEAEITLVLAPPKPN